MGFTLLLKLAFLGLCTPPLIVGQISLSMVQDFGRLF